MLMLFIYVRATCKIFINFAAWYDETTQYQRSGTELEKTFEERQTLQRQGVIDHRPELKPKVVKEPETEWQHAVKKKKSEEYYNKLQELENEQVIRESKIRESTHQFAIPGDKISKTSIAKGMAQRYEDSLLVLWLNLLFITLFIRFVCSYLFATYLLFKAYTNNQYFRLLIEVNYIFLFTGKPKKLLTNNRFRTWW